VVHVQPIDEGGMHGIGCEQCHDTNNFPLFSDGQDLDNTTACDTCHSADGVALAKQYWNSPGSWVVAEGEASFCGSCHDETPGYNGAIAAFNVMGDKTTYGYFVTGHGKDAAYDTLSWQDSTADGNPGADQSCGACHDLTSPHYSPSNKRLMAGFENDQNNSNCNQCHAPGNSATADPQWYTVSADYESSAHSGKLCTECHEVHGAAPGQEAEGQYPGMTKGNQETLCYQCHTDPGSGGIQNAAISGTDLADDIEQAFSMTVKHDFGTPFTVDDKTYSLECVSCHNVHIITGKYWEADLNKSPVTRFPPGDAANLETWGDEAGEKMDDYAIAGDGTYRTPKSDTFSGSQLPDYDTFCLDCHAQPATGHTNFGINWTGDAHGTRSADAPAGGGVCPNWYGCGKAEGWDGDDCVAADPADCWPVITRGKGDQLFSRKPYNHDERVAGANFTLACSDCHEAHGSNEVSMLRTNPNGGTGTVIWNTMCNNCHYYYSDWHAGMSCGTASCHVTNSIHRMNAAGSPGGIRPFDPDLVVHYAFNNNLKDSGDWQMDGKWMDDIAGSYTSGKYGQAIVLDGGKNVQVGTENEFWSTDAGRHGTHIYTEMKFNSTLEAWVYPTDDANSEYSIFTKHVGYNSGGYAFTLKKIGSTLRAAFNAQVDNNGTDQDGMAGVRGAYSSVAVPLNTWTHVAATFDTGGADRDDNDPAVGRIRIYVNGEDVTTSDASGNFLQPGVGETSIFAYPENSPWNEGICYNGHWCTGEFSVGGFYGWQNEFIGRIDEAKVWNVTKDAAYFDAADQNSAPFISSVAGIVGGTELTVTFSEGVYANVGQTGNLQAADFVLADTNGDNPRTITGVTHTAGSITATVTMSQPLAIADIAADTLEAADSAIYDDYNNAAGSNTVTIGISSQCPTSPVTFELNEANGSTYVMDSQDVLYGTVTGGSALTGFEFAGDGTGSNYINFPYSTTCLQADTKMTVEARVKPTGIGTDNYITRILARDGGGNFQLSVWRNNNWTNYNAPDDTASIALWVYPLPAVGNAWKPVLTDYDLCPIINDHWYKIKAVWDSDIVSAMPSRIFVDDQGTDGSGTGENWDGYIDCTNSGQTYNDPLTQIINEGDTIKKNDGSFAIGINRNNLSGNNFNGLIDWIIWKDSVD
jgi:predicted CXXCH cytochrome family protein